MYVQFNWLQASYRAVPADNGEVTWRALPFGVPYRPMHRGVTGR